MVYINLIRLGAWYCSYNLCGSNLYVVSGEITSGEICINKYSHNEMEKVLPGETRIVIIPINYSNTLIR